MLIFAAETSCDETSICLMRDGEILEHIIFSQEIHKKHGGVVPELASRSHLENIQIITKKILKKNNVDCSEIDIFAATCGPGLIGSLLIGSTFVKSLSLSNNKPFIPINHLEGHIHSTSYNNEVKKPHLILLLTGGHTQMYLIKNDHKIELLGQSIDDALGEVFDKVAKLLGMNYPGGAEIENQALNGDENFFKLPKPLINENNLDFSFSGLKTHINLLIRKSEMSKKFKSDLCASFQKTILQILVSKTNKALEVLNKRNINIKEISIVGGVSNNRYLRDNLEKEFKGKNVKTIYPIKEMMSDNAAMIAWACNKSYNKNMSNLHFKINPRLKIL